MKMKLTFNCKRQNAYGDWNRIFNTNFPEFNTIHVCKNPFTKKIDTITVWSRYATDSFIMPWDRFLEIMQTELV